jgi:hypothetical protein
MDEWIDEWKDGCMNGCLDGWMVTIYGWMDEEMCERMNGWMNGKDGSMV